MMEDRAAKRVTAMRNRPGQGLVEFVLILPLLLAMIFGLIEFARAWNIRHVITDAAREGARVQAVVLGAPPSAADSAINLALSRAGLSRANATVTIQTVNTLAGQATQVTIVYPFQLRMVGTLIGSRSQVNIGTAVTMRNE